MASKNPAVTPAQLTKHHSSGEYRRDLEVKKRQSDLERAREVLRLAESKRRAVEEELAAAKELFDAAEREAEHQQLAPISYKGRERELRIGQRVAAEVGRKKFADCRIVDIAIFQNSGHFIFELERLDEGKSIRFKTADELFPVELLGRVIETEGDED